MLIKLECSLDEIRKALNYLRIALPKRKCDRKHVMIEIFFQPEEIRLSIIGAQYTIKIPTGIKQKVFIPFVLLERITQIYQNKNFIIHLDEGLISYDGKTIPNKDIMLISPDDNTSLELTMNYTDLDLLVLEYLYQEEYLEKMKLMEKIYKAKERLDNAVYNASEYLERYGVTYEMLMNLVMNKIFRKKLYHM